MPRGNRPFAFALVGVATEKKPPASCPTAPSSHSVRSAPSTAPKVVPSRNTTVTASPRSQRRRSTSSTSGPNDALVAVAHGPILLWPHVLLPRRRHHPYDVGDIYCESGERAHETCVPEGKGAAVGPGEPVPACAGGVNDADDGLGWCDPESGQGAEVLGVSEGVDGAVLGHGHCIFR